MRQETLVVQVVVHSASHVRVQPSGKFHIAFLYGHEFLKRTLSASGEQSFRPLHATTPDLGH